MKERVGKAARKRCEPGTTGRGRQDPRGANDMVVAHNDQARANRVRAEPGPLRLLVAALFDVSSATALRGDDER